MNDISWESLDSYKKLPAVLPFLKKNEPACILITERIRTGKYFSGTRMKRETLFAAFRGNTVAGCLYINKSGLCIPFLPLTGEDHLHEFQKKYGLAGNQFRTLLGDADSIWKVRNFFELTYSHEIDYHLMTRESPVSVPVILTEGAVVTPAHDAFAEILFTLHKRYEMEEVYVDAARYNADISFKYFKRLLREQLVFCVLKNGVPVAKANTNARGYNYYQIGGVFTEPDERRKGFGYAVVGYMINEFIRERKHLSLYVKKSNHAAVGLYRRLGFKIMGNFLIDYLQS